MTAPAQATTASRPRAEAASPAIRATVEEITQAVRDRGDGAVREYSERFDGWAPESFRLTPDEVERIVASVDPQVIDDIRFCQAQVRRFAEAQLSTISDVEIETIPGVTLGHRNIPVSSVGAYVPGGRYPMVASAHMSVLTAKVAGVERVAAVTPPMKGAPRPRRSPPCTSPAPMRSTCSEGSRRSRLSPTEPRRSRPLT